LAGITKLAKIRAELENIAPQFWHIPNSRSAQRLRSAVCAELKSSRAPFEGCWTLVAPSRAPWAGHDQ